MSRTPRRWLSRFRARTCNSARHESRRRYFRPLLEQLEERRVLAVTTFVDNVLTIDFSAADEILSVSNNGTQITISSNEPISGDGDTFSTADVQAIVVTDSGDLPGQALTFTDGATFSLSGGLSSAGVETVTFDNAVSATGASSIDISAPRNIVVNRNLTGGSGGLSLSANQQVIPTSGNFVGVVVKSDAVVSASGAGPVSIHGRGGDATESDNHGVHVTGFGSRITSAGGAVLVEGTGGGSGSSVLNIGVFVESGGVIASAGTGVGATVTVIGHGGNTSGNGSGNMGVMVFSIGSQITSAGGAVHVEGTGGGNGATSFNHGVLVRASSAITSAGATATVTVIGQGGNTTGSGASNCGVTVDNGGQITSGGGAVSVQGTGGGSGTGIFNHGVFVDTSGEITAAGSGTVAVVGNGGNTTGTGQRNFGVHIQGLFTRITSSGGNVSVSGTGGGAGDSFDNYGVSVQSAAQISAGGSGTVAVVGHGGNSTGSQNFGVLINGAQITSAGGAVHVEGTGGGADESEQNFGVSVQLSGQITAGGSGTVTVVGHGGNTTGAGAANFGVRLSGTLARITSSGGSVSVSGTGGGAGISPTNFGVSVENAAEITAGGSGTVVVIGNGGNTTGSGAGNDGIRLITFARITSNGGNVSVTGSGGGAGGGSSNFGVRVDSSSEITAAGSGTVTVVGNGGNTTGTGNTNVGVQVAINAQITSSGGNVSVTGSGSALSSFSNFGVWLSSGGKIAAGGSGTVTVVGNGGGTSGGSENNGVNITEANSRITSAGGNISVTGVSGSGTGSQAIRLEGNGQILGTVGTPTVTLTADSMEFLSTNSIDAGANMVILRPRTAGTEIDLGGSDVLGGAPLALGLSGIELNRITAGTLRIGRNDLATGAVTVSAAINPANAARLEILTARNILVNANLTGGSGGLSLSANQQATPTIANFAGVVVQSGAVVSATGSGAVTVLGRGGVSTNSDNMGVVVSGAGSQITSAAGNVSVTGVGGGSGGSSSNVGVRAQSGGQITAGDSGAVAIFGSGGNTGGTGEENTGVFVSGAGSTIASSGGAVQVEGVGASDSLAIQLESNGSIASGGNAAITITADSLAILSNAAINSGTGTTTIQPRTAGTEIDLGGGDVLGGSPLALGLFNVELNRITAGTLRIGRNDLATGAVTVSAAINPANAARLEILTARNILVNANLTGGSAGLLLSANQQAAPTNANFAGVAVQSGAVVSAAGSGAVAILGRGGVSASDNNSGVVVDGAGSQITSAGGAVLVEGTGGGSGGSLNNHGVLVRSSGAITSAGTGPGATVTIVGNGGITTGAGAGNFGVYVLNTNSRITSGGGNVSVTGTGGGAASSGNNRGVQIELGGEISAGGNGTVTVVGSGGNTTGGGGGNLGVVVLNTNSRITSGGGNVSVTGTGGGGAGSANNSGVQIELAGEITAGGNGTVAVVGVGGNTGGFFNFGLFIVGAGSRISSSGGAVSIEATGTNNSSAVMFEDGGAAVSGGNTAITVTADSFAILNGGAVNSGTGTTTIQPRTAGTEIDLGGADVLSGSPLVLGLSAGELNQMAAGTLIIGKADSGPMTISADITLTAGTSAELISGGDIVIGGGQFDTGGGTLRLVPGAAPAAVKPTHPGVDVTASTLFFGSDLEFVISGPAVDADYTQLNVSGAVDLTGVGLSIGGSFPKITGLEVFTLVAAESISGTFVGLDHGAPIDVQGQPFVIQYSGTTVRLVPAGIHPPTTGNGNVTARLSKGNLVVTGDNASNSIQIVAGSLPGEWLVIGIGNTTINGKPQETVAGVRQDVQIRMQGGNDFVLLPDSAVPRHLTVDLGAGNNRAVFFSATTGRNLTIRNAKNSQNEHYLLASTIGENVNLNGQAGADRTYLAAANIQRDLIAKLAAGDDELRVFSSQIGRNVNVQAGLGNDTILFQDANIGRDLLIAPGQGGDNLLLSDVTVGRNATLRLDRGPNTVEIERTAVAAKFDLAGGNDADQILIGANRSGGLTAGAASFTTRNGNDTLVLLDSVFAQLAVNMGGGNNELYLEGNTVNSKTNIRAGKGNHKITADFAAKNQLGALTIRAFDEVLADWP